MRFRYYFEFFRWIVSYCRPTKYQLNGGKFGGIGIYSYTSSNVVSTWTLSSNISKYLDNLT